MATLPLGGVFYRSDSLPISAQEAVNVYLNRPQTTSVTRENLFTTPGIPEITTAGESVNRGGHVFLNVPYVLQGEDLFRIDRFTDAFGNTTFSSVQVNGSTIVPGSERVMMADNGTEGGQLAIIAPESTDQFNLWIFEVGVGLTQVSDPDFDGPVSSLRYVDGFFLFTKKDSQKFFISNLRDGFVYTATDFASAEVDPDSIVAAFILSNEPYIFGTETIEPFQNIGGAGFPFQRIEGGVLSKGLDSRFAIEEINDIMVFLGSAVKETPSIWATDGTRPQKLSTTAIDNTLSKFTDSVISSCFSWKYTQSGAQFVGFTFPGEITFVYDFASGEWHTRESVDADDNIVPYRISVVLDAYGGLLVADTISNKIGILDKEIFTEFDETMRRRFVTPQLDNEGQPFWVNSLELWGEAGIGLPDGSDPQVLMSFSRDGGRTFNNPLVRSMGKRGEFDFRTIWNSLGRVSREICFKFEVSDRVKWVFSKVEAEIDA